jgi:hypothetical protein
MDEPIPEDNKGYAMLAKMGWSSGQGLGRESTAARTEPIRVSAPVARAGLGASGLANGPAEAEVPPSVKRKAQVLAITRERYENAHQ